MANLPLRYTYRNVIRRKTRALLTLFGLGLAVGAVVLMLAFAQSIGATFRSTGDEDNIIVISKKAENIFVSSIDGQNSDLIKNKFYDRAKGLQLDEEGFSVLPMISPEVQIGLSVAMEGEEAYQAGLHRAVVHGLDAQLGLAMNSAVELVEGRIPEANEHELLVGRMTATRLDVAEETVAIGRKIYMLDQEWTIVGRFSAPGSMMDCEIWAPYFPLQTYLNRYSFSYIRIKVADLSQMKAICDELTLDQQYEVEGILEQDYFADYAAGFDYFQRFAQIVAAIIICGGLIAGMNTMYTAVLGRIREIGVLQVIGFSKRSVMIAILTESMIISLAGGVLGCALGYLANGLPMKMPMMAFRITVGFDTFVWAMLAAVLIGIVGAFAPARQALKLRMVDAVRYQ